MLSAQHPSPEVAYFTNFKPDLNPDAFSLRFLNSNKHILKLNRLLWYINQQIENKHLQGSSSKFGVFLVKFETQKIYTDGKSLTDSKV